MKAKIRFSGGQVGLHAYLCGVLTVFVEEGEKPYRLSWILLAMKHRQEKNIMLEHNQFKIQ